KYSGMRPLAPVLARLLDRAVPARDYDAIVPVPLHWRRRWHRGFNQAEALAHELGRRRGIPVLRALSRRRATVNQAGLTSAARRRNIAGAFLVRDKARIEGKKILLIDDVMTTGATASACARALMQAGAESVSLATVARADRKWK